MMFCMSWRIAANHRLITTTPFMGVGSEVYSPLSLGRKAIGVELKESYYKQALQNIGQAKNRFINVSQSSLFD